MFLMENASLYGGFNPQNKVMIEGSTYIHKEDKVLEHLHSQ